MRNENRYVLSMLSLSAPLVATSHAEYLRGDRVLKLPVLGVDVPAEMYVVAIPLVCVAASWYWRPAGVRMLLPMVLSLLDRLPYEVPASGALGPSGTPASRGPQSHLPSTTIR